MTVISKLKSLYKKYKQPLRGFLGWLFAMLAQVTAVGVDVVETWSTKRWVLTLSIAALPGVALWMRGGDPNPSDEEIYEKVKKVKLAKAVAAQGQATTPDTTDPAGLPIK